MSAVLELGLEHMEFVKVVCSPENARSLSMLMLFMISAEAMRVSLNAAEV